MKYLLFALLLAPIPAYAVTNTTNYSFNKPAVNDPVDQDLWGDQLNDNWDSLDTELLSAQKAPVLSKTSAYTIVAGDRNKTIWADATGGAFTLTLPAEATAGDGWRVTVIKIDSSSNAVTIEDDASATVSTLASENSAVRLVTNGTSWESESSAVSTATTSVEGVVELATSAEMVSETASKIPTADIIKNSPGVAKAWGSFDGTAVNGTADLTGVNDSYNLASVVDNGTGSYTVSLDTDCGSANYVVTLGYSATSTDVTQNTFCGAVSKAADSFRIDCENGSGAQQDNEIIDFSVYCDQ